MLQSTTHLKDFQNRKKMTTGTTSSIYTAMLNNNNNNQDVIIKKYFSKILKSTPESFQREVDILTQCRCQSIIPIIAYNDDEKYIVIEKMAFDLQEALDKIVYIQERQKNDKITGTDNVTTSNSTSDSNTDNNNMNNSDTNDNNADDVNTDVDNSDNNTNTNNNSDNDNNSTNNNINKKNNHINRKKYVQINDLKIEENLLVKSFDHTTELIILIGVSYGMRYLHRLHIVMRDLKPSNILLDWPNLYPKLCDFGYSKQQFSLEDADASHQFGTAVYYSPEVIKDNLDLLERDVYSFGMLAYKLITRKEPFFDIDNETPLFQFFGKVFDEGLRPSFEQSEYTNDCGKRKSTIPFFLVDLMRRCWDNNPKKRPSFAAIFENLVSFGKNCIDIDQNRLDKYINNLPLEEIIIK